MAIPFVGRTDFGQEHCGAERASEAFAREPPFRQVLAGHWLVSEKWAPPAVCPSAKKRPAAEQAGGRSPIHDEESFGETPVRGMVSFRRRTARLHYVLRSVVDRVRISCPEKNRRGL